MFQRLMPISCRAKTRCRKNQYVLYMVESCDCEGSFYTSLSRPSKVTCRTVHQYSIRLTAPANSGLHKGKRMSANTATKPTRGDCRHTSAATITNGKKRASTICSATRFAKPVSQKERSRRHRSLTTSSRTKATWVCFGIEATGSRCAKHTTTRRPPAKMAALVTGRAARGKGVKSFARAPIYRTPQAIFHPREIGGKRVTAQSQNKKGQRHE